MFKNILVWGEAVMKRLTLWILLLSCLLMGRVALAETVPERIRASDYEMSLVRKQKDNVLTWKAVRNASHYVVYRAASPDGKYKKLATVTKARYTHKKAHADSFYCVRAVIGKKNQTASSKVGSVAAPKSLKAELLSDGRVKLKWSKSKYADGYTIQRAKKKTGRFVEVKPTHTRTSYTLDVDASSPVYFRVISEFRGVKTGESEVFCLFDPVKGLVVSCKESYDYGPMSDMRIKWAPSNGATAYEVYRTTLPSENYTLVATVTDPVYFDKRLPLNAYAYKVQPLYGETRGALTEPVALYSALPDNILPPSSLTSETGIIVVVNKGAQVVTAYQQDSEGKYTIPLRHMICSSGKVNARTPNGTWKLSKRQEWYRYPSGVYIRYPVTYKSGLYFHSVLYRSKSSIMTSTIRRLGTRQSLGCIRLKVNDAKWLYDSVKNGTTVYITDGKNISGLRNALKPKTIKF